MVLKSWISAMVLLAGIGLALPSWAEGALHLKFHIGGHANNKSFVGGTVENLSNKPVAHGYIVVTLLDRQCNPKQSLLKEFGGIASGGEYRFNVPIDGKLERYRLLTVKSFDEEGFEIMAVDDNAELLKGREPAEREYCSAARH